MIDRDAELGQRLRAGDRQACAAFVDAHYRDVHRLLVWLTGSADAAADLTQETFAAFWESLPRVDAESDAGVAAWLFGIARNRWRKHLRDFRPLDGLEEADEVVDPAPEPDATLIRAADVESVLLAMAGLPPELREALALRAFRELSYREIAALLCVSEPLARWRVHQPRKRLCKSLWVGAIED